MRMGMIKINNQFPGTLRIFLSLMALILIRRNCNQPTTMPMLMAANYNPNLASANCFIGMSMRSEAIGKKIAKLRMFFKGTCRDLVAV